MTDLVDAYLNESLAALSALQGDPAARAILAAMADRIAQALRDGRKLLIAGNGGSAADAQHIACEIVGRLWFERDALPAIALTADSSVLTALSNDYGYEQVFARQIQGLGQAGDVFLGISTSGRTANILRALETAKGRGLVTFGWTGSDGEPMRKSCDLVLEVPSSKTSVIQQVHIVAAHIVCGLVEQAMFPGKS